MKFLISNDDGVYAPGLQALFQALSTIGEVVVVAPNDEYSGCASALSISKPLYTHQLPSGFIAVNGSPADCVHSALYELYPDTDFDCVITGINSGANIGQDVMFSGTFGAALTAQVFGIPAIATSLVGGKISGVRSAGQEPQYHYQIAANEIVKLLTDTPVLDTLKDLPYHVLNVNIPDVSGSDAIKGRKITSLGHRQITRPVHHMVDPRGRDAYWLSLRKAQLTAPSENSIDHSSSRQMSDDQALAAGYISLSPVRLHHTPAAALQTLSAVVR